MATLFWPPEVTLICDRLEFNYFFCSKFILGSLLSTFYLSKLIFIKTYTNGNNNNLFNLKTTTLTDTYLLKNGLKLKNAETFENLRYNLYLDLNRL